MPPSALKSILSTLRYTPILISSTPLTLTRSLFSHPQSPSAPSVTRYLLRQPFAGAPRECPTPVILVRAIGLSRVLGDAASSHAESSASGEDEGSWEDWGGMFSQRGYTALEVDITAPTAPSDTGASNSGSGGEVSPLKAMSSLLASQIRLLAIPFPPILIASGPSCLLTQTYIEDNPASGLVLVDPPSDQPGESSSSSRSGSVSGALGKAASSIGLGHSENSRPSWPSFNFEPKFPILLVSAPERVDAVRSSRLGQTEKDGTSRGGKGVMVEELVDGSRGEKSRIASPFLPRWLEIP